MTLLSITLHSPAEILANFEKFITQKLTLMADNLMDVEKYVLSEVENTMISEGKNYNLLLFFEDEGKRQEFLESEFMNITEHISAEFGSHIIVFESFLHPLRSRL